MPRPLLVALVLATGALLAWLASDVRTEQSAARGPAATVPSTVAVPAPPAPAPAPAQTGPPPQDAPAAPPARPATRAGSVAVGLPFRRGRLVRGVQLPAEGADHLTWDGPLRTVPSRPWRRWGTDVLVATVLRVLAEHRAAHPGAPRVLVGDLSRPRGGIFDRRFGGLGHASHQNGLDADVFYPRRDRLPIAPERPSDVDRALAQDLVDRFLAAGAQHVFVGRRVGLRGPRGRVQRIPHHDDHLHVRLPNTTR